MRSFRLALLAFALAFPAQAQLLLTGAGRVGGVVGYQGPGDITSGAIAFYSAGRAYNVAYAIAHSPLADVVDTSTGLTTCTFHALSTGFANPAECNATACATACSVTKMYDQTVSGACGGSCDVVQATLANMPGLTLSAQNGLPCAAGTNNAAMMLKTAGNNNAGSTVYFHRSCRAHWKFYNRTVNSCCW